MVGVDAVTPSPGWGNGDRFIVTFDKPTNRNGLVLTGTVRFSFDLPRNADNARCRPQPPLFASSRRQLHQLGPRSGFSS